MTDDLKGITKLPKEGARWIDEPLRGALRELRTVLLSRADGKVPAAQEAWTEAAQMVAAIMQQHGIEFEEPLPEHVDITPAVIERLLDEAELSRGPMTPASRAMLAVFNWMLDQSHPSMSESMWLGLWVRRSVALWGEPGSGLVGAVEEIDRSPPPAPDNPIGRD